MGQVFLYLCILRPSVFMISLGSNLVFSDANPRKIVKRGCTTLIAFLLLNIVRDGIPDVVVALTGHPSTLDTFGYDIFASDILGFAGFVFLFFRTCQTFSHCFIGYAADFVMHVDG